MTSPLLLTYPRAILKRWRGKQSFWALSDQGLVSLGSFATQLVIARHVAPGLYGTYSLLLGVILFVNGIHGALVTYPLSFRLATANEGEAAALLRTACLLTTLLALPAALLGAGACAWLHATGVLAAFLFSLLSWEFQEVFRRALMARMRYASTIPGDAVSYLLQPLGMLMLAASGRISLGNLFWCAGATSLVAAAVQCMQTRSRAVPAGANTGGAAFWNLGKWALGNRVMSLTNAQAFTWFLGISAGPAAAAGLQAVGNALGATHPAMFGIANVMLPSVAKAKEDGTAMALDTARRYSLQGAALIVPYLTLLVIAPEAVLHLLYGAASAYGSLITPMRIMAGTYFLLYLGQVTGGAALGLGHASSTFWSGAAGTMVAAMVGLPLVIILGIDGAALGYLASTAAVFGVNSCFLRRSLQQSRLTWSWLVRGAEIT